MKGELINPLLQFDIQKKKNKEVLDFGARGHRFKSRDAL
jgi:hypothetical protein